LDELIEDMAPDEVSLKRFKQAANNVRQMMLNMAQRRTHRLPEDHLDYTAKEE
jgi:fructose 1,6-bisphosphatase